MGQIIFELLNRIFTEKISSVHLLHPTTMKSIRCDGKDIFPTKIVCVGRNYAGHVKELKNAEAAEPVIFIKPNSAIATDVCFNPTALIHYEAELTFLIRGGKLSAVGLGLDLTKRELQTHLQAKGLPWERAKAFDGSAVFSDFVTYTGNLAELNFQLFINDTLVQHGNCGLMLHQPEQVFANAKGFLTFEDGDLLMTGTPQGVGPVKSGDKYRGRIATNDTQLLEALWVVV